MVARSFRRLMDSILFPGIICDLSFFFFLDRWGFLLLTHTHTHVDHVMLLTCVTQLSVLSLL